jgi:hypothetical protein
MTEQRKRTNVELWAAIEKLSDEAELARINALDDPELDRELRAAGIDPDKAAAFVHKAIARTDAAADANAQAGPKAASVPSGPAPAPAHAAPSAPPPRRIGWVPYVAAAAVAMLVATALTRPDANTGSPAPDSSATDDATQRKPAAQLRAQAFEACAQTQWRRCAVLLDEARLIDPAGEADPRVVRWREAIRASSRGP